MSDQSKELFGCSLATWPVGKFLSEKFYVIPAYQRGFKWGESQVNTLLKEIVVYYNRYMERETNDPRPPHSLAKFIGTIINVEMPEDTGRKMIVNPNKKDQYVKLSQVIDGQQRLTLLTLLTICVLRRFELFWVLFDEKHFESVGDCAPDASSREYRDLIETFFLERIVDFIGVSNRGGFSPRLTREHKDKVFATTPECFNTVTAELAFAEATRVEAILKDKKCLGLTADTVRIFAPQNSYRFNAKNDYNTNFDVAINIIDDFLDFFILGHLSSSSICKVFEDVKEHSIARLNDQVYKIIQKRLYFQSADSIPVQFMRLITLWQFIEHYVFLAAVECPNDNALDIFEALNTAGRSLTTVETFIPEVHRYYDKLAGKDEEQAIADKEIPLIEQKKIPFKVDENGIAAWECEASSMLDWLNRLRVYCENDNDDNNKSAIETVISFALIYAGHELEKTPSSQRIFLREQFQQACDKDADKLYVPEEKYSFSSAASDFVVVLTLVSEWWSLIKDKYEDEPETIFSFNLDPSKHTENLSKAKFQKFKEDFELLEDEAQVALNVLIAGKFKRPLSIACRFWIEFRFAHDYVTRLERYCEFLKALRALVAFTSIWISHHGGTSGIEDAFLKVFVIPSSAQSDDLKIPSDAQGISFVWRNHPRVEKLKTMLKFLLADSHDGNFCLDKWIAGLKKNKPAKRLVITKFLNLAYWHNSIESSSDVGLRESIVRSDRTGSNFLSTSMWDIYSSYDLEHVLPQTPDAEWKTMVPDADEELINSLGNTTLLQKGINRYLQNNGWQVKQAGYTTLCLKDAEAVESFINSMGWLFKSPQQARNKIQSSDAQTQLKELTNTELKKWDREFINQRTERMAQIIWKNLAEYLDLPPEGNVYTRK